MFFFQRFLYIVKETRFVLHRSVSLPPVILEKIEGERPTSPVFLEAQQFVRADVEASFKTFFKVH